MAVLDDPNAGKRKRSRQATASSDGQKVLSLVDSSGSDAAEPAGNRGGRARVKTTKSSRGANTMVTTVRSSDREEIISDGSLSPARGRARIRSTNTSGRGANTMVTKNRRH